MGTLDDYAGLGVFSNRSDISVNPFNRKVLMVGGITFGIQRTFPSISKIPVTIKKVITVGDKVLIR